MKDGLINHLTWLANRIADCGAIDGDGAVHAGLVKDVVDSFYHSLNKATNRGLIPWKDLTQADAKELRFRGWMSDEDIDKEIAELNEVKKNDISLEKTAEILDKINALERCRNLYLIPKWLMPTIPKGTELITIGGEKIIYNGDIKTLDGETQFGCLAYGVVLDK